MDYDTIIIFLAKFSSCISTSFVLSKPLKLYHFLLRGIKFTLKLQLPAFINKIYTNKFLSKMISIITINSIYYLLFRESLIINILKDLVHFFFVKILK